MSQTSRIKAIAAICFLCLSEVVQSFTIQVGTTIIRKSHKFSSLHSTTSPNNNAVENGIEVGDTKGAAIMFEDIAISRGSNRILSNVNLRVERNNRWGKMTNGYAGRHGKNDKKSRWYRWTIDGR